MTSDEVGNVLHSFIKSDTDVKYPECSAFDLLF